MKKHPEIKLHLDFDDSHLLTILYGEHDRHLKKIESALNVSIHCRGSQISIVGETSRASKAQKVLSTLYEHLKRGFTLDTTDIDNALHTVFSSPKKENEPPTPPLTSLAIPTQKIIVTARTTGQEKYIKTLRENDLVFALGPAGCGKTYLAVAMGVSLLFTGQVQRMVLTRPAVEAGEHLGFLPGNMKEKVDPYLRPLYDALYEMMPAEHLERRLKKGEIEIAPLAFMRGRTLSDAFVILDEGQNALQSQMRMFLTRMGHRTKMVVTGDLTQVDLPKGIFSGLRHAIHILEGIEGIGFSRLEKTDVVRHKLVKDIIEAYETREDHEAIVPHSPFNV